MLGMGTSVLFLHLKENNLTPAHVENRCCFALTSYAGHAWRCAVSANLWWKSEGNYHLSYAKNLPIIYQVLQSSVKTQNEKT